MGIDAALGDMPVEMDLDFTYLHGKLIRSTPMMFLSPPIHLWVKTWVA